jgi:hypothetical protein
MALQLGQGGRRRSLQAMIGESLSAANYYVSFYFSHIGALQPIIMNANSTLESVSDYEIIFNGGSGSRVSLQSKMGIITSNTAFGYGEVVNTVPIQITPSTALAQVVETFPSPNNTTTRSISHVMITTRASGTSNITDEVIAFGPLLDPITSWTTGDTLSIPAGQLSFRQS